MKPTNQTPLDEATRQISALLGERLGSTLAGLFDLMGIAEDEISAALVRHRVHACLLHATMSCFRVDDSAPAIVARAAAPHTRPASRRPASPALPRYRLTDSGESLMATALLWHEFALSLQARFDVEQKALDVIVFTVAAGGTSFAIPSKLEGTARRSHTLENIRRRQLERLLQELTLSFGREDVQDADAGSAVVLVCWNTCLVGFARSKHQTWLLLLLETGRLGATSSRLPTVSTTCCGNSALIEIESATAQEADELRRLEWALHDDLIEYEFQRIERENARRYGGSYVPPRVCEPGRFIPETL